MKNAGQLALAGVAVFAVVTAAHAGKSGGLVGKLRAGGYVLLMRHASSPPAPLAASSADPQNRTGERQLDAKGRADAIAMGVAMRRLQVPLGQVYSSPTYRARETLRLARIGPAKTIDFLGDRGNGVMMSQAASGGSDRLRKLSAEAPLPGTDTVIVTHMPNILAAYPDAARGLGDGEALVLRPDHGNAVVIARIPIEEWPILAGMKR